MVMVTMTGDAKNGDITRADGETSGPWVGKCIDILTLEMGIGLVWLNGV
jgi:hypothetical protein